MWKESALAVDKEKANMNKSEGKIKKTSKIVSPRRLDLFDSAAYSYTYLEIKTK